MSDKFRPPQRSWFQKFRDAFRGIWIGMRGQRSFAAHFVITAAAIAAGVVLRVKRLEWCILALCITVVLSAELFNSALESLAKAIDTKKNPHLADGLDIASGAVLVAAIGAALTGVIVLLFRLGVMLEWWAASELSASWL